jgi:pantothenate kinase
MDAQTYPLPNNVRERVQGLIDSGARRLIGIVAPPGAGKSTFAHALVSAFPDACCVVPMDGFHLANSELERLGRRSRKGAPDTFDPAGYVQLLRRLRASAADEIVYAPDYRRELEEGIAGAIAIDTRTPVIFTEGNYLLLEQNGWGAVRGELDEVWYLDVDDGLREQRLLERHMRFGRSRDEALQWMAQTDAPNALRITRTRPLADLYIPWNAS